MFYSVSDNYGKEHFQDNTFETHKESSWSKLDKVLLFIPIVGWLILLVGRIIRNNSNTTLDHERVSTEAPPVAKQVTRVVSPKRQPTSTASPKQKKPVATKRQESTQSKISAKKASLNFEDINCLLSGFSEKLNKNEVNSNNIQSAWDAIFKIFDRINELKNPNEQKQLNNTLTEIIQRLNNIQNAGKENKKPNDSVQTAAPKPSVRKGDSSVVPSNMFVKCKQLKTQVNSAKNSQALDSISQQVKELKQINPLSAGLFKTLEKQIAEKRKLLS